MKRTEFEQINTPELWDTFYHTEEPEGFVRILETRRKWMLDTIRNYGGSSETFLDVGCGWGETLEILNTNMIYPEYTGVDICKKTIARQQEKPHNFVLASAENLPFKKEKFDIVWCGETIEHLTRPKKALNQIKRVTKKGGLIMITVPLDDRNNGPEHTYYFSRRDLCGLFPDYLLLSYGLFEQAQQCAAWIKI